MTRNNSSQSYFDEMSMLAEPRRKQRISVDPQNKQWVNDDTKFGKKMLEKMGWQSGNGLGAREQGTAVPIKLKVNYDNRGLGCEARADDTWLTHQDAFDDILKSLNADTVATVDTPCSTAVVDVNTADRKTLVEHSRKIRYLRFAKGKDVQAHSKEDVQTVLGHISKRRRTAANDDSPAPDITVQPPDEQPAVVNVTNYYEQQMRDKLAKLRDSAKKIES